MKNLLFILVTALILSGSTNSQWNAHYTGINSGDGNISDSKGKDVKVDHSGDCYVTGYNYNTASGNDILLIKYNAAGDTVWTRTYDGTAHSDDQGLTSAVDASGNVYVTGYVTQLNTGIDIIVLKYSPDGALLYNTSYPGCNNNTEDRGLGIAVDNLGDCFITGFSTDDLGLRSVTTLKFDPNGILLWNRIENSNQELDGKGLGIAVDNAGNSYISGYLKLPLTGNDIFVLKYDPNGTTLWMQTYDGGANMDDQAACLALDASGNIYIAGYATVNILGNINLALLKYNNSGTPLWQRFYNGTGTDKALGIAVDQMDGSIYVTGYTATLLYAANYLTEKFLSDGTLSWSQTYNGPGNGDDKANAIALVLDANHNVQTVVVTGGSWGGSNTAHDYATVKYAPSNGAQILVSRYSFSGTSDDIALGIAVDNTVNRLFITGASSITIGGDVQNSSSSISTLMMKGSESSELNTISNLPVKFSLSQNYPNPFNPSTNIKFDISVNSNVKLVVYDIMGKEVTSLISQNMSPGSYNITFNMPNLASGIYFYELNTGSFRDIKKMTLIK